jgi:phosphate transport system protein
MSDHTHKQFDAEMEEIRSGVLAMGGLVETQLTRAIDALKHPDNIDLIASVAADERAINQMQVSIDQQCSQIIAKRQPAAIDLRMVLTVVKIVNELERIGDEIKKIDYKAQQKQRPECLSNVRFHEITRAAELAESNLQLALTPRPLDVNAAAQVVSNDEAIDSASADPSPADQLHDGRPAHDYPALEIVFIAKSIERIGDHAKNVAENVVHVVKGKDVRHATAEQIRAEVAE